MKALLYVRVSTEEQARRGYSIPEQLEACTRRAVELGAAECVPVIDDVGGDQLERPKLEQARQLVRSGAVGWFICFDPDRFSRDLLNQLLVTDEIDRAGVELIFIQHNRQKTPEGDLFYAIRGAISQFEKKKILERTQRGKRGKAKQGLLPGHLDPYGYRMDTGADCLVIDEVEARWVRWMFALTADPDPAVRLGPGRIAGRLNQSGVPAPRGSHWYRSTVAGILHNLLYTGVLRWGRFDHGGVYQSRRGGGPRRRARPRPAAEVILLPVPALVSTEQFERARAFLALDRSRRSRGRTYMLTGMAFCGRCGGHLQTKRTGRRYLVCANRYPALREMSPERRAATQPCGLAHIRAEAVEAFVWQRVCAWMVDPALAEQAVAGGRAAVAPTDGAARSAELAAVEAQVAELEKAQSRVVALVARGKVRPELAEEQLRESAVRLEALARRRQELTAETPDPPVACRGAGMTGVAALVAELQTRLDALSEPDRIHLVRRLVARVVVGGSAEAGWQVLPIR